MAKSHSQRLLSSMGRGAGGLMEEEQQVSLKDPQDGGGRAAGGPVGASGDAGGG